MNRLITYLLGFCVFFVVAVPQHMPAQAETMTDYQAKLGVARQSLKLSDLVTLDKLRGFRTGFASGLFSKNFDQNFQKRFEPAHGFDVIMEQLANRRDDRYFLDKAKLSEMGLTPSQANVTKLRKSIRGAFRDLTNTNLKFLVTLGAGLYIYHDGPSNSFKYQLSSEPTGKPHFRLTPGHIMDFAFVDGVILGEGAATQNMSSRLDKTIAKFKTRRESKAITSICNKCLSQSQAEKGLAFCYIAGLVKGDALQKWVGLEARAKQGKADAQLELGLRYRRGQNAPHDKKKGTAWILKAAEQGHIGAQAEIGVAYYLGLGVAKSDTDAAKWYRKAAEQGHAKSQYDLGGFYRRGTGVRKDFVKAEKWALKAAEQGHTHAQFDLGLMYQYGKPDVPVDLDKAIAWYGKAAANGYTIAKESLDELTALIASARGGDAAAQYKIGFIYNTGNFLGENSEKAAKWYRMAAAQGHVKARKIVRRWKAVQAIVKAEPRRIEFRKKNYAATAKHAERCIKSGFKDIAMHDQLVGVKEFSSREKKVGVKTGLLISDIRKCAMGARDKIYAEMNCHGHFCAILHEYAYDSDDLDAFVVGLGGAIDHFNKLFDDPLNVMRDRGKKVLLKVQSVVYKWPRTATTTKYGTPDGELIFFNDKNDVVRWPNALVFGNRIVVTHSKYALRVTPALAYTTAYTYMVYAQKKRPKSYERFFGNYETNIARAKLLERCFGGSAKLKDCYELGAAMAFSKLKRKSNIQGKKR